MKVPKIRGLVYTGEFNDPRVNGGQPLPLYEPAPRTDGRPDINTVEGWNRMRHGFAARALRKCLGREPDESEIQAEMDRNAEKAQNIIEQCMDDQNKLPAYQAESEG